MTTDVVIVGGGILGATLGWKLAGAGAAVTLIDPQTPDNQTSVGSLAWLNVSSTADPAYARLRLASMRLWHDLVADHPDCPARFAGTMFWGNDPAAVGSHARALNALDWPAQVLDAAAIGVRLPGLAAPPEAMLSVAGEGAAHPERITGWMLARARAAGVDLKTGQVAEIITKNGNATGVMLSDGTQITARHVVVTAGISSRELLGNSGLTLPLRQSPGILMITTPTPRVLPHFIATPKLDFWQDDAGRVLMSSSLAKTGARADDLIAEDALGELARLFPALAGARVKTTIRRHRPIPADGFPIVGPAGPKGLYVAVTHSGMTLAPVIAEALTDDILARDARHDLSKYRLNRDMTHSTERAAL